MYTSTFEGVTYIEGMPANVQLIKQIRIELNHMFSQNQLKTLDDVKREMNKLVLQAGGNCVVDFKYGQTSSFWKSIFGMDDILWYGHGCVARI